VLRFPDENALDVGVKITPVDVHFIETVGTFEYLLETAVGVLGQ
jgi:hypothetical protein